MEKLQQENTSQTEVVCKCRRDGIGGGGGDAVNVIGNCDRCMHKVLQLQ